MAERTLIILGGPTASGKTDAGIALARHFGTEVISADSRQFYQAMRIGTARPLEHELGGVKHHFLGHLELDETWSAGRFAREAEAVLEELRAKHGIVVLVGGSGLYIDALVKGLDPLPTSDPRLRERLQRRIASGGLPQLIGELERLDPATAARIDASNPHRVIRALEVCLLTGKPFSEQPTDASDRTDMRIVRIAMDVPRDELYARIDARVDRMMAEGLQEEASALLPHHALNALQTVGYKELFLHFNGKLSLADAVVLIKQHSRNYAKRQMTWLRRDAAWHWVAPTDLAAMIAHVERGQ